MLSLAPSAGDALLEFCGIPRQIDVDDETGVLEVEACAAGLGGEENPAVRVFFEGFDFLAPLDLSDAAGVPGKANFGFFQMLADEGEHADPFGKYDDLGIWIGEGGIENFYQFVEFWRDACFLIEDELGVTDHPHFCEQEHEDFVLFLAQRSLLSASEESLHLHGIFVVLHALAVS